MTSYAYIDVSRKQEFIYRHNRLSDNLKNSNIIRTVTEEIGIAAAPPESLSGFLEAYCKDKYEFIYSGGGNSIIKFKQGQPSAEQFAREYSTLILRLYPELEVYISTIDEGEVITKQENDEMQIRQELIKRSDRLKDKRRAAFRRWTYGIEKLDETGKPLAQSPARKNFSHDMQAARDAVSNKLKLTESYIIDTNELQNYKQENGKSYIGIIAIDGNKMGEMVEKLKNFQQLRDFSNMIENIYIKAVRKAIQEIGEQKNKKTQANATNNSSLLYTPIVLAGDDICLITEGEYAIKMAVRIVENIRTISESDEYKERWSDLQFEDVSLSACAGVVITRATYPFFEAVTEAEAICEKAKETIHKVADKDTSAASFIDWHIVEGQVMAEDFYEDHVRHQRDNEYFHIKPLRIDQKQAWVDGVFGFPAFERLVARMKREENQKSFLEQVRKEMYSGWNSYKLLFESNKTKIAHKVADIVKEHLVDDCKNSTSEKNNEVKHAAIIESNPAGPCSYTYVLHDVLETMGFLVTEEDEASEATE